LATADPLTCGYVGPQSLGPPSVRELGRGLVHSPVMAALGPGIHLKKSLKRQVQSLCNLTTSNYQQVEWTIDVFRSYF